MKTSEDYFREQCNKWNRIASAISRQSKGPLETTASEMAAYEKDSYEQALADLRSWIQGLTTLDDSERKAYGNVIRHIGFVLGEVNDVDQHSIQV